MVTGIADLTSIRAKIRRAKEHHDALITEWNTWSNQQANIRICYIRRDGPWYVVTVQPFPQPDIRFSIIAGDIIHNLRSALDHLVWQLVLRDGHDPTRRNEFPIYEIEKRFLDEVKFRKKKPQFSVLYGITINGDAWTIIENAQPYKCVPLYSSKINAIGHLSNCDKHRTLYSHIPFAGFDAIRQTIRWNPDAILLETRSSIYAIPLSLEKETEIIRYRFSDEPDPQIYVDRAFSVDPSFGEGEVKGGIQVGLIAFDLLIGEVSRIIDEISKLPNVVDI